MVASGRRLGRLTTVRTFTGLPQRAQETLSSWKERTSYCTSRMVCVHVLADLGSCVVGGLAPNGLGLLP